MLRLQPIGCEAAKKHVARLHRHNCAPLFGMFAASVVDEAGAVQGVAIVSHPTARGLMDGWTCEVSRVATNGAKNACSMLYGACCRAAKALGYRRIVTYTLASEPGTSLRAAGWVRDAKLRARSWEHDSKTRIRFDYDLFGQRTTAGPRVRWIRVLVAGDTKGVRR